MRLDQFNRRHGFLGFSAALFFACALIPWARGQEGSTIQAGLEARLHPQSPVSCGIDIVEVGTRNESSGEFLPELALLQDRYDSSFPDTPPKIRFIYSYAAPPSGILAPHPTAVAKIGTIKRDILTYVDFKLAATAALFAGPVPGSLAVVSNALMDAYRHSREFYRTEALYTLDLLANQPSQNLYSLVDENALHEAIARSREYSFRGLFIPSDLTRYVWEYQQNEIDEYRTQSYDNLLSILNREGLIAYPLSRDFILVYFDPRQPHPRAVDFQYTDLDGKPLTGTAPIPLGVYGLGLSSDRILDADLTGPKKAVGRRWVQRLTRFGLQTASVFIPLPLSLTLYSAEGGTHFVLQKEGDDLYTSTLRSQAELIAVLQSGLAHLDPKLVDRIRSEVVTPRSSDPDQTEQFRANARLMTDYLTHHSDRLCSQIKKLREKEYEKVYLTFFERLERKWDLLWRGRNDPRNAESRREIISERHDVVAARITLKYYDESRISVPPSTVVAALALVGPERRSGDDRLIARILLSSAQPEIELAALNAAGQNRNESLGPALAEYLSRFTDPGAGNADRVSERIQATLAAIDRLRIDDPHDGDLTIDDLTGAVAKLLSGPAPAAAIASQAQQVLNDLSSELAEWRNLNDGG